MIGPILDFSVRNRWTVLLLAFIAALVGAWSLTRLPIDATPDITNNQAQINTLAPSLSPYEIEKQVTFPIETALAGIPWLESTLSSLSPAGAWKLLSRSPLISTAMSPVFTSFDLANRISNTSTITMVVNMATPKIISINSSRLYN